MTMGGAVLVPNIGDFEAVEVIEVLVAPGDAVEVETPLVSLESDKATMDVPSDAAGIVKSIAIKVGDKVSQGAVILELEATAGGANTDNAQTTGTDPDSGAAPAPAPAPAPASAPVSAPPAPASAGPVQVKVPDIGDFEAVEVIEVLVAPGDTVEIETPLVSLESDKATMDVPSDAAGTVKSIAIKVGDKVSQGAVILELEGTAAPAEAGAASEPAAPKAEAAPEPAATVPGGAQQHTPAQAAPAPPAAARPDGALPHASPGVRRFARELGADIGDVPGSAQHGRIVKEDVRHYVHGALTGGKGRAGASGAAAIPAIPAVDFADFGEVELEPLNRVRKISGPRLHAAWLNVPHVTHHDEADITELEALRGRLKDEALEKGARLTALAFIAKALARALEDHPNFNVSLAADGEHLVLKKYVHVGIAVDTPNGLLVPVLRDANRKSVLVLAAEMGELSKRARDGKLKREEMQGGCMTITSLGGIGGAAFTPIINAPEVAILGVSRSRMTPVWNKDKNEFEARLLLPLDLSYDHRVIDGAAAARFSAHLCQLLGNISLLLL